MTKHVKLIKKVLVLHAEKGLVRAGAPDLTLFHQVEIYGERFIAINTIIITNKTTTIMMTFFPTAVLGCCLFLVCHGPIHLPNSTHPQVDISAISFIYINYELYQGHLPKQQQGGATLPSRGSSRQRRPPSFLR